MPAASAVAAAVLAAALAAATPAPVVRTLTDPRIDESSGLAVSQRHPGLLWTHNDGGQLAQVFGIGPDGTTVATVTLAGIDPYDPEALAPGTGPDGEPALFLGDIGDNLRTRRDISVFRLDEPASLGDTTAEATWYRFRYPDGPHDAEALLVGPHGRILIATKGISGQGLYRAPARLVTQDQGTNTLRRIAEVPSLVTDGAYLPDGRFVLRSYSAVFVYDRPGHEVARAELPGQPQGESVAADDDRLLVGSEGVGSEVLAVPVPGGAGTPAPTGTPSSSTGPVSSPADGAVGGLSPAVAYAVGSGVLLLLVGLLVVAARRRRH